MSLKVIFMGTPEFAVPSLEALKENGYDIKLCVTQPDKPSGRGNKITYCPVKAFAIDNNIDVLQPETVKTPEFADKLRSYNPDVLITAAYGKILPKDVLEIAPLGCINVHASLLPKYRGSAPIWWVILNGESETGVTTMFTDVGMDTGDILLCEKIEIDDSINTGELYDKLADLGAKVLIQTLKELEEGILQRKPQDGSIATYAPMIKKEMGLIDWAKASKAIHNQVRGLNPWPSAYTFYQGKRMKIFRTELVDSVAVKDIAGRIISVSDKGILVSTGDGAILITEIQFDSSKRLSVMDYLRGHNITENVILGQEY